MNGKIRFPLKKLIYVANRTGTHLLGDMRSDQITALEQNWESTVKKLLALPRLPVSLQFSPCLIVLTFIMTCWITAYFYKISLQNEGSFC